MSLTMFLADDHAVVRDGLKLWLGTQADPQVVSDASDGRDTAPGWQSGRIERMVHSLQPWKTRPWYANSPSQGPKILSATVKVVNSNCHDFLTERQDRLR